MDILALLVLFFCPKRTFSLSVLKILLRSKCYSLCRMPAGCFPNAVQRAAHSFPISMLAPHSSPCAILSARSLYPQKHSVNIPSKLHSMTISLPNQPLPCLSDGCERGFVWLLLFEQVRSKYSSLSRSTQVAPARQSCITAEVGRYLWELLIKKYWQLIRAALFHFYPGIWLKEADKVLAEAARGAFIALCPTVGCMS